MTTKRPALYPETEAEIVAGIERGRADMLAGRTVSHDEAMARIDATIALAEPRQSATKSTRTPSEALETGRGLIRDLVARHRARNPRVFGSVLDGTDGADSDLDMLVETTEETTLFDLGGLQDALQEALGVRVDVRTLMDLSPRIRAEVLRQAVPV